MAGQRIGELNGKWALSLKLILTVNTLAILPFIGWATYVTQSLFEVQRDQALHAQRWESFINAGPRYTTKDAIRDGAVMRAELSVQLHELSTKVEALTTKIDRLEMSVDDVKKKLVE